MARVFDCFTFFDEFPILSIRLKELAEVVDVFVLVEATRTHRGEAKPPYFWERQQEFAEYLPKIRAVVVDDLPAGEDPVALERFQRNCIVRGLNDASADDIVLISDADEIPAAAAVRNLTSIAPGCIAALEMRLFYYALNWRMPYDWDRARAFRLAKLRTMSADDVRRAGPTLRIPDAGWHFSYLALEKDRVARILKKARAFSHAELDQPAYLDERYLRYCVENGFRWCDEKPFVTWLRLVRVDESFPRCVVENLAVWGEYIVPVSVARRAVINVRRAPAAIRALPRAGLRVFRRMIPGPLKRPLRLVRLGARKLMLALASRMRARAYREPRSLWLRSLPAQVVNRWRLLPPPRGARRIEVGSGGQPQPGYVHVDVDPSSPNLDLLTPGYRLPVADGWADEILSIHMIEHIPPPVLDATLSEWYRVLRPGGQLVVHTPSGTALARALLTVEERDGDGFWATQSALYGYGLHPRDCTGPGRFGERGEHRLVFTFRALKFLLEETGFERVEDVSGTDGCHHQWDWRPYVPGLCLAMRAVKPGTASGERE